MQYEEVQRRTGRRPISALSPIYLQFLVQHEAGPEEDGRLLIPVLSPIYLQYLFQHEEHEGGLEEDRVTFVK